MSLNTCCAQGFRLHSRIAFPDGEWTNWYQFGMSGDGLMVALQFFNDAGDKGIRVYQRASGSDEWSLFQEIIDANCTHDEGYVDLSRDGTTIAFSGTTGTSGYNGNGVIKVYKRTTGYFSLYATLALTVTYAGTDYSYRTDFTRVQMSDDGNVIVWAQQNVLVYTRDALTIWDNGTKHQIITEGDTIGKWWCVGVSGDGSKVYAQAQDTNQYAFPSNYYTSTFYVSFGQIWVYEKVGGVWQKTGEAQVPSSQLASTSVKPYCGGWGEIRASYNGDVFMVGMPFCDYWQEYEEVTGSGVWKRILITAAGLVEIFRKSGTDWVADPVIMNPLENGIYSIQDTGSVCFGLGIHMTSDGSRFISGTQYENAGFVYDYSSGWSLARMFDVADDYQHRINNLVPDYFAYGSKISADGNFVGFLEHDFWDQWGEVGGSYPVFSFYEAC